MTVALRQAEGRWCSCLNLSPCVPSHLQFARLVPVALRPRLVQLHKQYTSERRLLTEMLAAAAGSADTVVSPVLCLSEPRRGRACCMQHSQLGGAVPCTCSTSRV